MRFQWRSLVLAAMIIPSLAQAALAGMPSVSLSEVAAVRLQTISFFLVGFFISSAIILAVWNSLAKDFPRLPRLTFGKACGVVFLWGLLFVVVLTMISGARELMTPGAWKKNGATYKLRDAEVREQNRSLAEEQMLATRREWLSRLGESLVRDAREHDGRFPESLGSAGINYGQCRVPDGSGLQYVYVPEQSTANPSAIVAYEPIFYNGDPLVLLTNWRGEGRSV